MNLLQRLVELESPSSDHFGCLAVQDVLGDLLAQAGGRVERCTGSTGTPVLIARFGAQRKPILLLGHVDTVWPKGTLKDRPYTVEDGIATGPGVYDMKAGLVQIVMALEKAGDLDVTVLLNADEELGSPGSQDIIMREAARSRCAMVLEPCGPGGSLKTRRKGIGMYTLDVTGRAAHPGLDFAIGVNAAVELGHQVTALAALSSGDTTVNVGTIAGGTGRNVVAAQASAQFETRFWTAAEGTRVDEAIRALTAVDDRASVRVTGGVHRVPMERTDAVAELVEAARACADWDLTEMAVGGVSDGNITAAAGVPTIDGLGADGGGAHAIDERVVLADIPRRAAWLAKLLRRLEVGTVSDPVAKLARLTPEQRARLVAKARQDRPAPERKVPRVDPSGPIPASFAQEQLWFLSRLTPGVPNYNVPFRFELDGPLDVEALTGAINEVVRRHDVLRTTLKATPEGLRQIVHPHQPLKPTVNDLSGYEDPDVFAGSRIFDLARTVFDLEEGPLWTAELIKLSEKRHVLVWIASHAIADGGSIGVIVGELAAAYSGKPLDPDPVQFGDFAAWQRQWLTDERIEELLTYWREQVQGYAGLGLSYDRPKRPGLNGRTINFQVPPSVNAKIGQLAKDRGASPFMVLLATYQVLLMRLSGRDDIAVATPLAGRDRSEFEQVAGSLTNTVVLRTKLDVSTFGELVDRVREVTFDALQHQDLPFGKLVEVVRPARDGQSNPITQTIFSYGGTPLMRGESRFGDARMRVDGMSNDTVRFDFELVLDEKIEGLGARFEYNADWIERSSAEQICRAYQEILAAAVQNPDHSLAELPTPELPDWEPEENIPEQRHGPEEVSPLEDELIRLWAGRLEVDAIHRDDDFFGLGGHSFLATELVADINEHLGSRITVMELFQASTVATLAKVIEEHPGDAPDQGDDLERAVEEMSDDEVAAALQRLRS
ncbi:hypothetical protein Lesp02_73750 [Lentzea sp. NBRC 105346]|uniref:M20/M25/M40 family metallo-hydrolase n=1 Tax=Lentzea sp. NBRC 105346 TaxID=3032205 RepID=UPI0024A16430|nr:M20/M25/M40 family metallo-hydrolase [Lentzea sp. NBRC 105346]GLZ35188.1 hypothetical protein Lesp02_73750 [Lentzea sp. NBRC 105346]